MATRTLTLVELQDMIKAEVAKATKELEDKVKSLEDKVKEQYDYIYELESKVISVDEVRDIATEEIRDYDFDEVIDNYDFYNRMEDFISDYNFQYIVEDVLNDYEFEGTIDACIEHIDWAEVIRDNGILTTDNVTIGIC